ncbi:MAG: hypothetical protein MJ198_07500 [Bacteroidales bacterium]|nr:hypothetical protein [Bacteroidales bacterium]
MKQLFKSTVLVFCILTSSINLFSQEIDLADTTDITPVKCLSEHRHFISTNTLQFATGTVNLNYECNIVPQFAVKVGVGTVMGMRILFNEAQQPCIPGGFYGMIEPRYYFLKASQSCMLQYGVSVSYKYWNFVGENLLTTMSEFKKDGYMHDSHNIEYFKQNNHYNVTDDGIYEKEDMTEHLCGVAFFGKGCIASGLTAEIEVGFGMGAKANKFYFTPDLGLSFGWTFGKKKINM